LPFKVSLARL
jgi:hypothetical protein